MAPCYETHTFRHLPRPIHQPRATQLRGQWGVWSACQLTLAVRNHYFQRRLKHAGFVVVQNLGSAKNEAGLCVRL